MPQSEHLVLCTAEIVIMQYEERCRYTSQSSPSQAGLHQLSSSRHTWAHPNSDGGKVTDIVLFKTEPGTQEDVFLCFISVASSPDT